jgi:hypothetical protein
LRLLRDPEEKGARIATQVFQIMETADRAVATARAPALATIGA